MLLELLGNYSDARWSFILFRTSVFLLNINGENISTLLPLSKIPRFSWSKDTKWKPHSKERKHTEDKRAGNSTE